MFYVMANGIVFSWHDTRAKAEISKARAESDAKAARLTEQAVEAQGLADVFTIEIA